MYVKQISVFIENTPGRLAEFTRLMGDHQIDLVSLSIADTAQFGILRGIVADWERAEQVIAQAGYTVRVTDVLAACVPDRPGGLAGVLQLLSEHGLGVEYLYSFLRNKGSEALIVFRVQDTDAAAQVLTDHGVRLLSQADVANL